MIPIPKPLLKGLVLTFLVGTGCFITGVIFFYYEKDSVLFSLSTLFLLFSLIKGASLFLRIHTQSYTILEGTCTDIRPKLLGRCYQVILTDSNGNEHHLVLGKNYMVHTGLSYRFYFKTSQSVFPGSNPLLEKAFLTDNLLGMESSSTPIGSFLHEEN